jgi:hypothetical protein
VVTPIKDRLHFSNQELFYLEQWTAFLTGVACLGVSLWAVFHSDIAFSGAHPSRFAESVLPTLGWLLTIAVAVIGTSLVRFALYKPDREAAHTEPETNGGHAAELMTDQPRRG